MIIELYEELVQLKDSPELFNQRSEQILEDFFNNLPEDKQRRLRGKHFKIQAELSKYKDPTAKMNKMVEIFWEGVEEFKQTLNGEISTQTKVNNKAEVVNLR